MPLKSVVAELMTILLRMLPQLCLGLLISQQAINSLVTRGFSGLIAFDIFNFAILFRKHSQTIPASNQPSHLPPTMATAGGLLCRRAGKGTDSNNY